jgi:hypothetical protein
MPTKIRKEGAGIAGRMVGVWGWEEQGGITKNQDKGGWGWAGKEDGPQDEVRE